MVLVVVLVRTDVSFCLFPVNLQVMQVSGTKSLKLGASPALPSGSANGVTRTTLFSSVASRAEIKTSTWTVVPHGL